MNNREDQEANSYTAEQAASKNVDEYNKVADQYNQWQSTNVLM